MLVEDLMAGVCGVICVLGLVSAGGLWLAVRRAVKKKNEA